MQNAIHQILYKLENIYLAKMRCGISNMKGLSKAGNKRRYTIVPGIRLFQA